MRADTTFSDRIILAIDDTSLDKIRWVMRETSPLIRTYKIGSISFTAFGPRLIDEVMSFGKDVFLDLKYFDIPNTVYRAVRQAASFGVKMATLHTLGGREMLKRSLEASDGRVMLLGVTLLTSMDAEEADGVGLRGGVQDIVGRLASLAVQAGLHGLVASGHEVPRLKEEFGGLTIVVPGIRPRERGAPADDQKRVVTPRQAFESGADYIVIGRPVTENDDPARVLSEICDGLRK
ncbi:MAG: orotidine-5'-phosphate decarboxylase [Deltaproteobacteria bacterium]|nr:orotidine-5'-phosphate decarboxylase [Deltaproteobacteria bacterium]MCL5276550.1 orotidine-5'-phosphate decarboxylase [Deltaproteobacteria bacterium]